MTENKKKNKKSPYVFGLLLIFIFSFMAAWYYIPEFKDLFDGPNKETYDPDLCRFDAGNRYESDLLNYMNVIYEDRANISGVMGTFSNTVNCPWGFVHEGFDFFLKNNCRVLAAAPGQVLHVSYTDNGPEMSNRYFVGLEIQYNCSTIVNYGFEPWTNETADWESQKSMISVKEGDWVSIGQEIGRFLLVGLSGHIHFDVLENDIKYCLTQYYSEAAYDEMMALINIYLPGYQLCYIE